MTRSEYLQKESESAERTRRLSNGETKRGRKRETSEEAAEERALRKREKLREERQARYEKDGLSTVGVRFPRDPSKEYTYLVESLIGGMFLGMEVVARDNSGFSKVGYLTRMDNGVSMPELYVYEGELKKLTRKVVDI